MLIKKGSEKQLTDNFQEKEFFSNSWNAPNPHYLDDNLIDAIQIIRNYYGRAIVITSSLRTKEHNLSVGGASRSQHLLGKALDFKFTDERYIRLYNKQIETKGELYGLLKNKGIQGFGIYDNFGHIDTRENPAFWDNRKKKA